MEGPRAVTGVVRVFLAPESAPNPPPALVSYDNTPSVLKAALERVRLPAVGVAGHKSLPLARRRRVIPTSAGMHTYVIPVEFYR